MHPVVGRHDERAANAMVAWFSGSAENFRQCSIDAGVTLASITGGIIEWAAADVAT